MLEVLIPVFLVLAVIFLKLVYRRDPAAKYGAPFETMPADIVEKIITYADIQEGDIFYDLGSGDGRLVFAAAMKGAKAYGVEIDSFRVWYSRLWVVLFGLWGKAIIVQKNFFAVDLSQADIVVSYLTEQANEYLQPKLEKELKKDATILAIAFAIPHWKPVKFDPEGTEYGPIYVYKRP